MTLVRVNINDQSVSFNLQLICVIIFSQSRVLVHKFDLWLDSCDWWWTIMESKAPALKQTPFNSFLNLILQIKVDEKNKCIIRFRRVFVVSGGGGQLRYLLRESEGRSTCSNPVGLYLYINIYNNSFNKKLFILFYINIFLNIYTSTTHKLLLLTLRHLSNTEIYIYLIRWIQDQNIMI